MAELKPNSHKYKAEEAKKREQNRKKVANKVTTGKVQRRKKSEMRKIADAFMPEDTNSMKSYIFFDLLVPKAKQVAEDVFHAILYGDSEPPRRNNNSHVSYNRYYRDREQPVTRERRTSSYNYDELIFESRAEAETVIDRMLDHLSTYDVISVGDFYEYAGVSSNHTDYKYGWMNIRSAEVVRIGGGKFIIKLPKAIALD